MGMLPSEGHAKDETRCYTWPTLHNVQFRISGQNIRDGDEGVMTLVVVVLRVMMRRMVKGMVLMMVMNVMMIMTGAGGNDDDDFVDLLLKIVYSLIFFSELLSFAEATGT